MGESAEHEESVVRALSEWSVELGHQWDRMEDWYTSIGVEREEFMDVVLGIASRNLYSLFILSPDLFTPSRFDYVMERATETVNEIFPPRPDGEPEGETFH